MRHVGILLTALALLLTGCGGESGSGAGPTTAGGVETTGVATNVPATTTTDSELRTVIINASGGERVPVKVEIADEPAEQVQGLMNRTALGENRGMLFVFESETTLSFWMKNTLIPLSIAYMDSEGRIVDIQRMEPLDETSHPSAEPAQYALEVNQGFFEEHGIEVGDTAELPV
ncbi:MAG: DUF192 domain-containing protein [Actinomycetota bacterium]|nr:DUF192 domain-containing protein [Actinomycetota bacterium]